MDLNNILKKYKGKKVLVTGHTGFKGSWMCRVLVDEGAEVTGYSLEPPTDPSIYDLIDLDMMMDSVIGDIRDLDHLKKVFEKAMPEIVIHMAAQPIVRASYEDPVGTYETNVMGTVNVLECVRSTPSVRSFVNVTTDKVYRNDELNEAFREGDFLNGFDPYSNSKSCSELVTSSYRNSFFGKDNGREVAISTMRAGNVIGGGDFARDRIIPDCVRAALSGEDIIVRNPYSIRPFQHVLEPVTTYLAMAILQEEDLSLAGSYNIGPDDSDCLKTGELATAFCDEWKKQTGNEIKWIDKFVGGPHEAKFLKLNCDLIKKTLDWKPKWSAYDAVAKTIEWTLAMRENNREKLISRMDSQIREYIDK
ncbi:MAG: CDP-glucose 4,6-dehydratase [Lachnospiraceae bacterium]|nr:CDP-glucose 4,6-dehydratase [Lachnospiraceae bacterium]